MFQSRNRGSFYFKVCDGDEVVESIKVSISESRFFLFQAKYHLSDGRYNSRFNLVIEVLFISSFLVQCDGRLRITVSISESRFFLFQAKQLGCHHRYEIHVSISESRFFSFQGIAGCLLQYGRVCFNLGIEVLFISS